MLVLMGKVQSVSAACVDADSEDWSTVLTGGVEGTQTSMKQQLWTDLGSGVSSKQGIHQSNSTD